jgi:hypothetical protein
MLKKLVLSVLAVMVAAVVVTSFPDLRRYLRMRNM